MSDTTDPTEPLEPGDAAEATPWYKRPVTWGIAGLVALLAVIGIIVATSGDDDENASTIDTTVPASTTSAAPTTTGAATTTGAPTTTAAPTTTGAPTTTAAPSTTAAPGPEAVVIEASDVTGDLMRYAGTADDMGFDDGDVTAHWYSWDGRYVVVYAGFDAQSGPPMCPGNSIDLGGGDFQFISNSPVVDGSCEPPDVFPNLIDEARVCDSLVLYHTEIPLEGDDGEALDGQLYGTIERPLDGSFVGATGVADVGPVTELDPDAEAYTVPDDWAPAGNDLSC